MESGQVFNRLTALSPSHKRRTVTYWKFQCSCGKVYIGHPYPVRTGSVKSCGCLMREASSKRAKERNRKHGMKYTAEYRIWNGIKKRCTNPNCHEWKSYGGRGISMCPEWMNSFEEFFKDVGPRPDGASIDRFPDYNGNYEPGNVRWSTSLEQGRNKRNNRLVEYKGAVLPLSAWSERLGFKYVTLHRRLHFLKWPVEKAFNEPLHFEKCRQREAKS